MIDIIEEIAATVQDEDGNLPNFYYGPRSFQNMQEGDTFEWLLYLDAPLNAPAVATQTGFIEEEYRLVFLLLYKSALDWSYAEHQTLIDKARYNYKRLVAKLKAHDRIPSVNKNIDTTDMINLFDVNLTGVMVEIRCTPNNPVKNC